MKDQVFFFFFPISYTRMYAQSIGALLLIVVLFIWNDNQLRSQLSSRPISGRIKGLKNKFQRWLYIGLFVGIPLNFIFGSYLNSQLIYSAGEPGEATVVGSYPTSTRYNNHDVVGYQVLIRTKAGQTIETSFEDDDFNVYPAHNRTDYPQQGDRFNVRYLKHFPGSFIIIANDDSPWAQGMQCGAWKAKLDEARSKFEFDKSNPRFKATYVRAIKDYIDNRCYTDSLDLIKYDEDLKTAESAKP